MNTEGISELAFDLTRIQGLSSADNYLLERAATLLREYAKTIAENDRLKAQLAERNEDAEMFAFLIERLPAGTFEDHEVTDAASWKSAINAARAKS